MRKTVNTSTMKESAQHGFTLIEVMITVVIISILAAIAVPSYQNSVQKSRRADAKACLIEAAAAQEKYFYQNNTYTTTVSDLNLSASCGDNGYYTLSMAAGSTGGIGSSYALTATRAGAQTSDTSCGNFTLSSTGVKDVASATSTASSCW